MSDKTTQPTIDDTMTDFRNDIARRIKREGFAVRTYSNAIFVYLTRRNVTTIEVERVLGRVSDLLRFRCAADPHQYNRRGVMITF